MAFFGLGGNGITLKELLEDPKLQNPPQLNADGKFDKLKGESSPGGFDFSSAFLGPNIWGNPGNDGDINLEYMDLDEFLSENGIPVDLEDASNDSKSNGSIKIQSPSHSPVAAANSPASVHSVGSPQPFVPSPEITAPASPVSEKSPVSPNVRSPGASPSPDVNFDVSDQDLALSSAPGVFRYRELTHDYGLDSDDSRGETHADPIDPNDLKAEFVGQEFDPKKRRFTEEELRPQPMIKKSRKVFVPDDCKDDKYWQRRKKNNVAAKRSRDARRIKENQIALRAAFLEKQTENLRDELEKMKKENLKLKALLAQYENKS